MSDGVITGAWISPDRTKLTIQVDEEGLYQFEVGWTDIESGHVVPADWEPSAVLVGDHGWAPL